eukprot:PITA_11552
MGQKIEEQQKVLNAMGSLFAVVLFIGVNNASSIQPIVDVEGTVFYREKAAGMYSAMPYALAQVLIEVPYVFVQAVVYGVIVMMTVALTPNINIAAIVSWAFYSIWMLFCGFVIPRPNIPMWWRWYYWACPVAWTLYGLIASQLGDYETLMTRTDDTQEPLKHFIKSYFGFRHSFLGPVAVVTTGWSILFAFIFAISIKKLNFQSR